jgi:RNA polymerase-binding transcription factor DksA
MRKSKRSIRRTLLVELLRHLKSVYDFELTPDAERELLYSSTGIDALLSFRSDSRLDDLHGALLRLESGKFGICIACKQAIAGELMDLDLTKRVCPSCEAHFNHRWIETDAPLALALQKSSIPQHR